MASLNTIALVGNLTRDPELRSAGGTSVLSGRLAFSRREKRAGEWTDVPGFVDVTLGWGNRADSLERILRKGSRIGVTGELRYREWETADGQKRSTLEVDGRDVMLLDARAEGATPGPRRSNDIGETPRGSGSPADDGSDIPFNASRI